MATVVHEIRRAQRADGPAAVLAIGTANPENCVTQDEYPDTYFRVTKSEHLADLKDKFRRICKKSGVEKRFVYLTEEFLDAHPDYNDRTLPTLDARVGVASTAVPALAASAATKAIAEWGRAAVDITHLVFATNSGAKTPGADLRLASLLGLRPGVSRTILSLNGCSGGGRALQLAKELAENNRGARVLVASCELTFMSFYGPEEGRRLDTMVVQALFGDGAGAVIVGADPVHPVERPLFEVAFTSQTTIPDTEDAMTLQLMEGGLNYHISNQVPELLKNNIERCLINAFESIGVRPAATWNDLFWAIHPGGRLIVDYIEELLGLDAGKLAATRHVLREFGNMSSATVIFVLDELRQRRAQDQEGEAAEWGVLIAFGPGITIETMVLHAPGSLKGNYSTE